MKTKNSSSRQVGLKGSIGVTCGHTGSSILPQKWRLVYSLYPMVEPQVYLPGFVLSLVLVILLLWSGICYFRNMERTFADVI
jgi:hypothetical protein